MNVALRDGAADVLQCQASPRDRMPTIKETVLDPHELQTFGARYAEAWCGQSAAGVAAFFSEGGSLRVNSADPAIGRAAIANIAQGFMTAFPDMIVTMDKFGVRRFHRHVSLDAHGNQHGSRRDGTTRSHQWLRGVAVQRRELDRGVERSF